MSSTGLKDLLLNLDKKRSHENEKLKIVNEFKKEIAARKSRVIERSLKKKIEKELNRLN